VFTIAPIVAGKNLLILLMDVRDAAAATQPIGDSTKKAVDIAVHTDVSIVTPRPDLKTTKSGSLMPLIRIVFWL
jgi:hypothetical protein